MDDEYVMKGNAAILKCSIPSFVSDFVSVVGWVDEEGNEFVASEDYVESKTGVTRLVFIDIRYPQSSSFDLLHIILVIFSILNCSIIISSCKSILHTWIDR